MMILKPLDEPKFTYADSDFNARYLEKLFRQMWEENRRRDQEAAEARRRELAEFRERWNGEMEQRRREMDVMERRIKETVDIIPEPVEQKFRSEVVLEEMLPDDLQSEVSVMIGKDELVEENVKIEEKSNNIVELKQIEEILELPTKDASKEVQIEYPITDEIETENVKNEEIEITKDVSEFIISPSEKLFIIEDASTFAKREAVCEEESETKMRLVTEIECTKLKIPEEKIAVKEIEEKIKVGEARGNIKPTVVEEMEAEIENVKD